MAKKKTTKTKTKTKAKSVRDSKVRVTSGWRREVEELGYTALQLERERKKMHAFRDRIGTNWALSLALGGIVRMKFTDGLTPDSTVFLSVNSARRLALGITELSERVPPEDESEDTEDFSEGIEYVAKSKRGRPKKKTKTTRRSKAKTS